MAWVYCMNCNDPFIQQNAYYTKVSCPRCERHSKLYGYIWPKSEPEGKWDKEERILDHRTVHRFLDPEEERAARGRCPIRRATETPVVDDEEEEEEEQETKKKTAARPWRKRKRVSKAVDEDDEDYVEDAAEETPGESSAVRRSGRMRRVSTRALRTR
jgi:histone-lysine N-methyltransferase SUV420H